MQKSWMSTAPPPDIAQRGQKAQLSEHVKQTVDKLLPLHDLLDGSSVGSQDDNLSVDSYFDGITGIQARIRGVLVRARVAKIRAECARHEGALLPYSGTVQGKLIHAIAAVRIIL